MAPRRRIQRVLSSDDESQPSQKTSESPADSSAREEESEEEQNDLIDLEAAEEDHEVASESSNISEGDGPGSRFHLFSKLPPELRDKIWELFCPDLTVPARIFRVGLELDDDEGLGHFWDGPDLQSMTETFRCLSSIHRESRQRALKVAPDEVRLGGISYDAVLRLNAAKDILCLSYINYSPRIEHTSQWQPRCGGPVQNIAISTRDVQAMVRLGGIKPFQLLFPELKVIYNLIEEIALHDRWLRWCVSDYAHRFYHERIEDLGHVEEVLPMLLCFPNTERYPDFAKYSLGGLARNNCDQTIVDEIENSGLNLWPMVSFPYMAGLERFEELEQMKNAPLPELPPDWPSDAEEEAMAAADDEEEDGYESEGIDDGEVIEDDLSSEDELVPRPLSPGSDAQSPISVRSSSDNDAAAANFSSIEPSDDEIQAEPKASSKRKRRVVSDSDDDGVEAAGSGSSNQRKRRRTRTLQSDSETEAGEPNRPSLSGSTSESESEEESSSSGSSDEAEGAPKKSLSLAQRLRQQQQQQQPTRRQTRASDADTNGDEEEEISSADDEDEDERPRRRGGAFFVDEAFEEDDDDNTEGDSDMD